MAKPIGAGRSSFELIDSSLLFGELHLEKGMVFLDLACGKGFYAIAAAQAIGGDGKVYAFDLWEEGIRLLNQEASARGIRNLIAAVADSQAVPLSNHSIDICLMATALHDLVLDETAGGTLQEIRRVLKPEGILAIVEFKKIEGPPGPPSQIRLHPEDVARIVAPYGFKKSRSIEVGLFNYLIIFS